MHQLPRPFTLACTGAVEQFAETEGYNPRESNVLRMLGYFSLIGLQRVHTLVGDYHGGLKAIHPLNLFQVRPLSASAHRPAYRVLTQLT